MPDVTYVLYGTTLDNKQTFLYAGLKESELNEAIEEHADIYEVLTYDIWKNSHKILSKRKTVNDQDFQKTFDLINDLQTELDSTIERQLEIENLLVEINGEEQEV
ncbi:hypothetical protein [Oceanobacillus sp. 1P07AA]|uniref:hypothetical protein n=1 Tax=Oceanobacillus sp. 1P07AA TaxID=3132293 RepID=UPI0039A61BAE